MRRRCPSGSPRRPSGALPSQRSTPSGHAFSMPALWISPGDTELTRMPDRPELLRARPGEREHRGLGRVVVAVVAGRVRRRDRADVDDRPAAALAHHGRRGLRAQEHRLEVVAEHRPPLVQRDLGEWVEREVLAGVVDQDLDRSEPVVGLGEETRDTRLGVELGGDRDRRAARRHDPSDHVFRGLPIPAIVHDHSCPGRREPRRDPGPDPLRGSGHDRDATGQVEKILWVRDIGWSWDASISQCPSRNTAASAISRRPRNRPRPRTPDDRRPGPHRPLRHPAPPRDPAALRLPPRGRRRARLVGRPQGPRPSTPTSAGWPSTSRTTRSSTSTSRASSRPSSTVPATSSSGTGAPGSRRRRRRTPRPPSRTASSSSSSTARRSTAGSRSCEPAAASARATTRRRAPSRTTRASSGCSSPSAARPRSRAGTPRTIRRASRPAGPTTTSRPTATRSGSARHRPPPPRST